MFIFSKSFGYSLRGVLFVALREDGLPVQLGEMAEALDVPRHFMGKIMKRLVKRGVLSSLKGPTGGFFINETTLARPLMDIYQITDHPEELEQCVLSRGPCNPEHPCRLHDKVVQMKTPLNEMLYRTTIGELLDGEAEELLLSLTAVLP